MANQYVMGLEKKTEELGSSQVVKVPEAEVTVFYVEGKELLNPKEPRQKFLFIQAVEKAFEPRGKAEIEKARKAVQEVNAKAERYWETTSKDDVELAKVVKGMEKSLADVCVDLQKKLLMACKISVEEGRKVGGFTGLIESHAVVKLSGKVEESSEAKGAMGAAMDDAEAKEQALNGILKLHSQMAKDLKDAQDAATRNVAPLGVALTEATDLVEDMKAFAKTKGVKESLAVKVGHTNLIKNLKLIGGHVSDANSSVWEAQRRLGLVEKEAKPLKSTPVNGQLKACEAAMDKAEDPCKEWLKGKPIVEAALKPWDTKTVRDFTKLALLLKNLKQDDLVKQVRGAVEQADKLRDMVEEAAKG